MVFLHTVKPGPASQSYGLQVAALAGVPRAVIDEARAKLQQLEATATPREPATGQLGLFQPPAQEPLAERLRSLPVDELSPRQALELLYQLKAAADAPKESN